MMGDMSGLFSGQAQQIVDTPGEWYVYDEYANVGEPGDLHIEGRGSRHTYQPLQDYPTLFAGFAQLYIPDSERVQAEVARDWAEDYGVLGLTPLDANAGGDGLDAYPQGAHDRDSVARFVAEARAAKAALAFYDAALRADLAAVQALDPYDEFYPAVEWHPVVEARKWGMHAASILTQGRVSAWCSPMIAWRSESPAGVWGFKSLAGAMWLQMFYALTGDTRATSKNRLVCANPDCPTPISLGSAARMR